MTHTNSDAAGASSATPQCADEPCDCCEINDYDGEDYGPCANCGHSPEEHGR